MGASSAPAIGWRFVNIDEWNTVETSVETSQEFIEGSIDSDLYQKDHAVMSAEDAAALTLLHNYIATFSPEEQERIESDAEEFYRYAEGFIEELAPYRYNRQGYNAEVRTAFLRKIRTLLNNQKDDQGRIIWPRRYAFTRAIVRFCSSLEFIIKIHDRYKKYLFRDLPQLKN